MTDEVRRGPPIGDQNIRALVPFGVPLRVTYEVALDTLQPVRMGDPLEEIVSIHNTNGRVDRFRVERANGIFHVVPISVRNAGGRWVDTRSPLDARITIPRQIVNSEDAIRTILKAASDASGGVCIDFLARQRYLLQHIDVLEADNEVARDVLLRTSHKVSERFTWFLLYGPGIPRYTLSLALIPEGEDALRARLDNIPQIENAPDSPELVVVRLAETRVIDRPPADAEPPGQLRLRQTLLQIVA